MADTKPQFANFKEAFCAYYRIRPEKYGRAVLWRSLPWTRRVLAAPILIFNRTFFATDLDIIRSLAPIRSAEEFAWQLDELHAVNRLERNIRRGFLGIRASGGRLMNLWKTVEPYVNQTAGADGNSTAAAGSSVSRPLTDVVPGFSSGDGARTSPAIARRVGRTATVTLEESGEAGGMRGLGVADVGESSALILRRLRRACDDTVRGIPMEEAVLRSGLESVPQFRRLLEVNAASHPGFRWLHDHLRLGEMRRQLEAENAGLKKMLADQAAELARLRSGPR